MKKGFTLIELLAVIVILSIITLIATPIISGIIEKAELGAFKDSAYGIEKAADFAHALQLEEGEGKKIVFTYDNKKITSSDENVELDFKGDQPQYGQVIIEPDGKIIMALHNGKYCLTKTSSTSAILDKRSKEECINLSDLIVTVEGGREQTIPLGEEYVIPTVTAKEGDTDLEVTGPIILRNGTIVNLIVPNIHNTIYTLVYTITKKDGSKVKEVVNVRIVDIYAPEITGVTKADQDWANHSVTIKVNAIDDGIIHSYSFDDGITWQESSEMTFTGNQNQVIFIKVKDTAGNISAPFRQEIKIDMDKPNVIADSKTITIGQNELIY